MKRILSLILLLATVCSLCVFAPSAAALSGEEAEALCEKYAPIIDALEAGDYSAALDAVWEMKPPVEYEAVEITPENFFDYFEIQQAEPEIYRYADGSIKRIWPGSLVIVMKEDVQKRVNWTDSKLKATVKGKYTLYRAKVDFETGEITLGDKMDSKTKKEFKKQASWFDLNFSRDVEGVFSRWHIGDGFCYKEPKYKYWTIGYAEPGVKTKYYQPVASDIEVSKASGTLYLAPAA